MHPNQLVGRRLCCALTGVASAFTLCTSVSVAEVIEVDEGQERVRIDTDTVGTGSTANASAFASTQPDGDVSTTSAEVDGPIAAALAEAHTSHRFFDPIHLVGSECYVLAYAYSEARVEDFGQATASTCASFDGLVTADVTASAALSPVFGPVPASNEIAFFFDGSPDTPLILPPPADGVSYVVATSAQGLAIANDSMDATATTFGYACVFISETPFVVGSCTIGAGLCINDVLIEVCDSIGGVYGGDASVCGGGGALAEDRHALQYVSTVNGEPGEVDIDLSLFSSPSGCVEIGACCVPGMECMEPLFAFECTDMGGVWQGPGIVCDSIVCPPSGACCDLTTGVCTIEFAIDCDAIGGIYQGDDTLCKPNPCDPAGACCFGADCTVMTETACLDHGGCYLGDLTSCGSFNSGGINASIDADSTRTHTITVPNIGTAEDVRVFVNLDIDDLSGLLVELEHCGTTVKLYDGECSSSASDMRARFRDGGTPIIDGCSDSGIG
ncbi:MAG: hypothetical protein AAF432_05955, partial [Planctomycetota bacterium]